MIRLNTVVRTGILAGLALGCIALSAPAFAAESDVPQAAISVRGVDFNSPRAVAHLKGQLSRVAMDICAPNLDGRLLMSTDERTCYETARKDGLAQIDSREQQAMRDHAVRLADSRSAVNFSN